MTREEAILELETMIAGYAFNADEARALGMAVSALRPVSREQVERVWRGEWIDKPTGRYGQWQTWCSACGKHSGIGGIKSNRHRNFCPNCGCPQTDEAVQMVMERLEAFYE